MDVESASCEDIHCIARMNATDALLKSQMCLTRRVKVLVTGRSIIGTKAVAMLRSLKPNVERL